MGKNLKLKAARAAMDMTQQELADAVSVTRQTSLPSNGEIIILRSGSVLKSARFLAKPWMNCFGIPKSRIDLRREF